jgi:hypothetical protein
MYEDYTMDSCVPPATDICIDGTHGFNINSSSPGTDIFNITGATKLKIINTDLVGKITVNNASAQLILGDYCFLTGKIVATAAASIEIDQSKILGDSTNLYCISVDNATTPITIKNSYLKGNTFAIYWNAANNNLKIKKSTVMHGSLGANLPFGRSGAQTPAYQAYHSAFNTNPDTTVVWTNGIVVNNNVFDAGADF